MDLRVERAHGSVDIYDRWGEGALNGLTDDEAAYIRDRLDEVIEDD